MKVRERAASAHFRLIRISSMLIGLEFDNFPEFLICSRSYQRLVMSTLRKSRKSKEDGRNSEKDSCNQCIIR